MKKSSELQYKANAAEERATSRFTILREESITMDRFLQLRKTLGEEEVPEIAQDGW
jgi:hypothetical protein